MAIETEALTRILEEAAAEGRNFLLEHEVYRFLEGLGCRVPRWLLVSVGEEPPGDAVRELGARSGEVVLKVVSPQIAHKTEVGGVAMVPAEPGAVAAAARRMLAEVPRRFKGDAPSIHGLLLLEKLPLEGGGQPGSELLLALRHNREFGPVLTVGVGGIDTELFGELCRKGAAVVSASTALLSAEELLDLFRPTLAARRLLGLTRAGRPLLEERALLELLQAFAAAGAKLCSDGGGDGFTVTELEVNPFGLSGGELIALDGLLRFRRRRELPAPRPLTSLGRMLRPQSVAVVGVSQKGINMGRIILRNLLEAGFDRTRAYVLRPGCPEIDGVRCVGEVRDLPERVDLMVVAVGAEQVPSLLEELAAHDRAVGVILIPGGMGEKEGGAVLEQRSRQALAEARRLGRPLVVNGGNSLGIVSRPGRYHTLFIPSSKLPLREGGRGNAAFISQSGAYMITRMSKLDWLSPRYAVSTGNQLDLTVTDFLRHLADDAEVTTFAVYVEGFADGDGLEFARAVEKVVASGRDVIFYKAGRSAEGKTASSGHTASLAGDYDVCEAILRRAGAHVAASFGDFLDLIKISSLMGERSWRGRRLAALSNAGFEAVGIADNLRGEGYCLELARFSDATRGALRAALAEAKLDTLVDVRNPLDLTPMAGDPAHEQVMRAFLGDAGVDLVLCASVPLTPAMATLGEGVPEEQSIRSPGSLPSRLRRLLAETEKPVVASLDSGVLFDPMARLLEEAGIPTFRSADQAVRAMGLYLEARLAHRRGADR